MFDRELDARLRIAAFNCLSHQVLIHGETLPRKVLAEGFEYQGQRVPLLGPQGIFKPALMDIPLSITTSPTDHMTTHLEPTACSGTGIGVQIHPTVITGGSDSPWKRNFP